MTKQICASVLSSASYDNSAGRTCAYSSEDNNQDKKGEGRKKEKDLKKKKKVEKKVTFNFIFLMYQSCLDFFFLPIFVQTVYTKKQI